jgi:hypothetical protein
LILDAVPPAAAPHDLNLLLDRAVQAWRRGDEDMAERNRVEVLELAPSRTGALSLLFRIRRGAREIRGRLIRWALS